MLSPQKNLVTYSVKRWICSSTVNNKNYMMRQGKFLNKIMHADVPKKKWYPSRISKTGHTFVPTATKLVSPHVTRRVIVLNKLFMKHVTDLMATGETSAELLGRGIEITQVKLSNDFKVVRVYWYTTNTADNELTEITDKLDQCAYRIRHELSQLKVIGVVPPIKFVRDRKLAGTVELDKRFLTADYGDDFTPTINLQIKPHLTLFTKLPDEVRKKITEIKNDYDENINITDEEYDELYAVDLPAMRHDVLGLNHYAIMSKVKQSLNKVKETAKKRSEGATITEERVAFDVTKISALRTDEETEAFNDFLRKRQIEEKRQQKRASNFDYNIDSIEDSEIYVEEEFDNFDENDPKEWQ